MMSSTITKKDRLCAYYSHSIVRYGKAVCFALLLTGVHLLQAQTVSNALDFDGTNDYVQLPNDKYFTQSNFTIETWVYPKAYNFWSRVIDFSNGPSSDNVIMALTDGDSGRPAGSVFKGAGGTNFTATTTTLALNTWSHLAITVKGSNARIYINGVLNSDFTNINEVNDIERTLNYIGKSAWPDGYADMVLDELKIWSKVLSAGAIADNMHKKPAANQAGLLVYFDFDQGVQGGNNTSITSLIDKSGNGHHGTFHNFTLNGAGSNFVAGVDVPDEAAYTFVPFINTSTTITKNLLDAAFAITATSTSPAPFTYSLESGTSISLNGATATIAGRGTSVVRISQAAVGNFVETYLDVTINVTTVPTALTAAAVPQPGGTGPVSIANGDLNADGFTDMAVAFQNTNNVVVYINDGTGNFTSAASYAAGSTPYSVAIGDLDGDGKLDLATANSNDNTVSVLINTGTGTFKPQVIYEVGLSPYSVAIGDLNGDSKADLAVANTDASTVSVLINSGTGTFATQHEEYEVGEYPFNIAMGDLDGDGKLDLAVANVYDNTVSVLINTGTGTFNTKVNYDVGSSPINVAIGDLDGDGKLDLVAANADANTVSVLINTGTGTFNTQVAYDVGPAPMSVAIGDLDGDGKLDLAVANSSANTVSILTNTGTGTFNTQVPYTVGSSPQSITIGDWNGDTKPDLATANSQSDNLSIIFNTGSGVFGTATNISTKYYYSSLAAGDLNGDGKEDLVIIANSNTLLVQMNLGNNKYASPVPYPVGADPFSVAIGDLNGDGKLDLATANSDDNTVSVLINTGTGTFNPQVTYEVGSTPYSIAIGDLDGDGKLDLAIANVYDNTVSVLINTGTGAFNTQVTHEVGRAPISVAIGDLDGDGKLDLATTNTDASTASVLINTGTGTFNTQVEYEVGPYANGIAMGDLDGDGKLDLAIANYYDNTASVLINTGTGTFNTRVAYQVGSRPRSLAIGDLNGDGKAELVVNNGNDSNVSVLNNTGDGFESGMRYRVDDNPLNVVITDLDGDGRPDLAGVTNNDAFTFLNTTALPQTITFAPLPNKNLGDAAFDLTATAFSGLAVTYTSSNTAVATVSGSTVTIVGGGTTSITASQAGAGFYASATKEQSLTVNRANQTILFVPLANKTYGNAAFALTATTDSNLPVSYTSSDLTVATISGNIVTIVGAGTTTITANQAGSPSYFAATLVERTLTVSKVALTAKAENKSRVYGTANPTLTIAYTGFANGDDVTKITAPEITTTATATSDVGTYPITLSGGITANYDIALQNATLTITKAALTAKAENKSRVYGATNPALTIAYTGFANSDDASKITAPVATVSATATSDAGTYPITLSGGAATNYDITLQNATLTITKAALTAKAENKSRVYGTANPSLTITYTGFVNGDDMSKITAPTAVISPTATSDAGAYPITLSGGTSTNYTFTLQNGTLTIGKADQAITFTALAAKTFGDANFTLTATSSSGLPVSYSSGNVHTAIANGTVTVISAGSETITASQSGNTNYNAAVAVSQSFCINPAKPVVTKDFANPAAPVLTSSATTGNQWYKDGAAISNAAQTKFTVAGIGQYSVKATVDNCASAMSDQVTIVITEILSEEASVFTVTPNPALHQIEVTLGQEAGEKQLEVISMDGKVMHHASVNGSSAIVQVSDYTEGMYIVKVVSAKGSQSLRFVKR